MWLGFCLLSVVGQTQFGLLLYGGTKEGLGLDDIRSLSVLVPPLTEQRAIAAHLDHETSKIDALVAHMQRAIERLREYRTALISAAVTGKIDIRNEGATQAHEPQ
jgi:type I restriction enzyme S subunit